MSLGGPINPNRLSEAFARQRREAGLAIGTLHTLRHTHATHLLSNGVPVHVAAARLGDDPTTLLDTYAHLLPAADEQAAERVAELIA